jgi:hypothetical protein
MYFRAVSYQRSERAGSDRHPALPRPAERDGWFGSGSPSVGHLDNPRTPSGRGPSGWARANSARGRPVVAPRVPPRSPLTGSRCRRQSGALAFRVRRVRRLFPVTVQYDALPSQAPLTSRARHSQAGLRCSRRPLIAPPSFRCVQTVLRRLPRRRAGSRVHYKTRPLRGGSPPIRQ